MARTKVTRVPQPDHDDFRQVLEAWSVPLNSSSGSLRHFLPLVLANFVDEFCNELEAELPDSQKSQSIHFMTATTAQMERRAAKGKLRAESPETDVEPAPAPVPAKCKKPVKPKSNKEPPELKQQAPNPYLAHRSSRRSLPVPSTSTGPQPPPDKPKNRRKKAPQELSDDEHDVQEDDEPDDDSSDEHGGGEERGGSSEEPEHGADGGEGAPEAEDKPDTGSGRDHTQAEDFQQLSLVAAPLPPELATGTSSATAAPSSINQHQRLTSKSLSALDVVPIPISSIAPSSTLSPPTPTTTDEDELMITDLSVPPAPPTPNGDDYTLVLLPSPPFRAPTPAQPDPEDSDSDDDRPRPSDLKRPRAPSSDLTDLTDSSASVSSLSSDSQSESESDSTNSASAGSLVVRLRIPAARAHPTKRLRPSTAFISYDPPVTPSLSPPALTYSGFASSSAQQPLKSGDRIKSNSHRAKRIVQYTFEIDIPRRRYRHGLVGPDGESEEVATMVDEARV